MSVEQKVWNYFTEKNFSPSGIAGIMGNLYKESKFKTNNLEDRCNIKFGLSDEQYTQGVDNNTYNLFINDGAGYGLAQWTWSGYKKDLYMLCKSRNKSISDLDCQLEQLYKHLQTENLLNVIKSATSIEKATEIFMKKFEKPADQSDAALNERIEYSKKYYTQFNNNNNNFKGGNSQMKYSLSNPPINCMMMDSTCYQQTSKMAVKGVLWHSTGANNKTIKRYVQPSDRNGDKEQLLALIGRNMNGNDWNHIYMQAGVNAWVGTLADGTVAAVQTLPWDYKPWGCGSGSRGSCNNGWVQFEICEDSLVDGNYFMKVYQEACELTAYICKYYKVDPMGTVQFNGITVPTILCHQDSYQLGLGTNHSDVYHWFNKYGKTMDDVRKDVAKLLGQNTQPDIPPVTPTPQPSSNLPLLRKGSDNEEAVKQLQKSLIKLGYNLGAWGADGDFGNATYNAVKAFQQKNGLDVDGVVGNATWKAIQAALSTTISSDEIYRVRKSWLDVKSQIGAYKNLNNAKAAVDKLNSGYHVYNSKGTEVYPCVSSSIENNQESNTPVAVNLPVAKTYNDVMLASASKDENGRYTGGQKGDQTGKEVYILNWYRQNWNYVLRPKTQQLAENIARAAEAGCANNNIGYNQWARNTLYIEAQKVGLDLSKVTTPCDCDCSSFVSICCICAGLSPSIFYQGGNMRTTYTMKEACEQTGQFQVLTGNLYTSQKDYLKRGDILLNSNSHVVIVLQDGVKAEPTISNSISNNSYKVKITANTLNIRAGADSSTVVKGQVSKNQIYTIVEETGGFGKLKSGAGWIDLQYTVKI